MSKKEILERHCVRCNRNTITPYIHANIELLFSQWIQPGLPYIEKNDIAILDIGCGNGRNSKALKSSIFGFNNILSFDMVDDYGYPIQLGQKPLPLFKNSVDVILANYVFMFLSRKEWHNVIEDIQMAARGHCLIIMELYPAKDSNSPDKYSMLKLQKQIFDKLGWRKIKYSQGRFIARR